MLVVGRAFMARPKLMILDEPSLGLSPLLVKEIFHSKSLPYPLAHTAFLRRQNTK
jgi:branched-chain amino acid transport system ATP-binding protein